MTELTTTDRNWSMMAHFSGAIAMFFLPSFGFVGPGLVWLLKQDDAPVVAHARQALYFQVAMTLIAWALGAAGTVLSCFVVGFFLFFLAPIPWLVGIIVPVYAGFSVNSGDDYRYPLTGDLADRPRLS